MKKYYYLFLSLIYSLSGCSSAEIPDYAGNTDSHYDETKYSIEEAQIIAIQAYSDFFFEQKSKSANRLPKVANAWLYQSSSSRASKIDTTFYIIEFEPKGFAIIAADKRLENNVYAISNDHAFGKEPIPPVKKYLSIMADEIKKEAEDSVTPRPWKKPVTPEIVKVYFINGVEYYGIESSSVKSKAPITKTLWGQSGNGSSSNITGISYNTYCTLPETGNQLYPAGCVPIAIAQLAAHIKKPTQLGSRTYNWDNITSVPKMFQLEEQDQDDLAYFIHQIGLLANVQYNLDGSGATFDGTINALQSIGFNTNSYSYFYNPQNSIDDNKPVLLLGKNDNGSGHAWITDGYRVLSTETKLYRKDNNEYYKTLGSENASYYMNWGWNGSSNGYYVLSTASEGNICLYNDISYTITVK